MNIIEEAEADDCLAPELAATFRREHPEALLVQREVWVTSEGPTLDGSRESIDCYPIILVYL